MLVVKAQIRVHPFSWQADNLVDLVAPVDRSADPPVTLTSPSSATATLYEARRSEYLLPLGRRLAVLAEEGDTVLSFESVEGWAAADEVEVTLDDQTPHRTTIASVDAGAGTVTLDDALPGDAHAGSEMVMVGYVAGKTRLAVTGTPWEIGEAVAVTLADASEEVLTIASKGEERGSPFIVLSSGLSGPASNFGRVSRRLGSPVNLSGYNLAAATPTTCDWGFRGVFQAGAHGLKPGHLLRAEVAYTEGTVDYRGSAIVSVR